MEKQIIGYLEDLKLTNPEINNALTAFFNIRRRKSATFCEHNRILEKCKVCNDFLCYICNKKFCSAGYLATHITGCERKHKKKLEEETKE